MSKNQERKILDALNESRKARTRRGSRKLNEAVDVYEDDLGDVEVVDVVAHVRDAYVDEEPVDPDYDEPNIHSVTQIDPMGDIEGTIDELDAAEPALFDLDIEFDVDDVDGDYDDDFDDAEDDFEDEVDVEYDFDDTEDDGIVDIEVLDDADEAVRTKFKKKVSNAGGHRHVVTAAQQKRRARSKKAGSNYKVLANGKKVRKTRAEKRREQSATTRRNLSKGSKSKARRRAAKTMASRNEGISASNWTNEQAFMTLLNGVLADARRKSGDRIRESKVLKVRKGTVRGNTIVMECVVRDGRGARRRADVTITGRPRGRYTITESAHLLPRGVKVGGSYRMKGGRFVFESMRYSMRTRSGRTINEGFRVVNG